MREKKCSIIGHSSWGPVFAALLLYYSGTVLIRHSAPRAIAKIGLKWIDPYIFSLIQMIVVLLFILFIMTIMQQTYIFSQKRTCFLKALIPGLYILLFSLVCFSNNVALLQSTDVVILKSKRILLYYVLYFLLVAVTEELVFRGIVADRIIRIMLKAKNKPSSVWKAVWLSGILFSISHASNLSHSSKTGVIIQMIGALFIGMVLTAVYYRTANIYAVIFLHAVNDIAAIFPIYILEDGNTISSVISGYGLLEILIIVPYVIVLMLILRRERIKEIINDYT